jgi:hypothetical protein
MGSWFWRPSVPARLVLMREPQFPPKDARAQAVQTECRKGDDHAVNDCPKEDLPKRVGRVAGRVLIAGQIREPEQAEKEREKHQRQNENRSKSVPPPATRHIRSQRVVRGEMVHLLNRNRNGATVKVAFQSHRVFVPCLMRWFSQNWRLTTLAASFQYCKPALPNVMQGGFGSEFRSGAAVGI